jgi:hypothetical protein
MGTYPYNQQLRKHLYKKYTTGFQRGMPLRAKVWWKVQDNDPAVYRTIFNTLEKVLTESDRFTVNANSIIEIFQSNYLYADVEDVIYFINCMRDTLPDPEKVNFDYRVI